MKTIGMIGGIGPESTVDYYQSILKEYQRRRPDGNPLSILINSIDLNRLRGCFEADDLHGAAAYLIDEVKKLVAAGADFGLISANTPHIVFDEVQANSTIPLVSIVDASCAEVKRLALKKVGLLGTRFTMRARFYRDGLSRQGIAMVVPTEDEQDYIHEKYFGELVKGIFLLDTRAKILEIIGRMKEQDRTEAVILAGTELPLLLRDASDPSLPLLDTTKIHVEATVDELLA